jgi:hypothetical protein
MFVMYYIILDTVVGASTITTTAVTTSSPYPFLDDSMPFLSLLPLPNDVDVYQAYQKIATSMKNAPSLSGTKGSLLSSLIVCPKSQV